MGTKTASKEDLRLFNDEALLGIIHDFLSWGGYAQAGFSQQALDEVARRVEERKGKVRPNEKILAVVS